MPSSYSPNLRLELIGAGEQAGTWGTTTNTNLGTLIEPAIAGAVSVSVTSANQALTAASGAADQSRAAMIRLTTTTTAPFAVYAPPVPKLYVVSNESAYQATIYNSTTLGNTTAAGAGVIVPAGKSIAVWSNGTTFYPQTTSFDILPITGGGTGASTAAAARTNLGLVSGTYTPTVLSSTGGISSITSLAGQYARVGDIVVVSGSAVISTSSSATHFMSLSIPVTSNFTVLADCMGAVGCGSSTVVVGAVGANPPGARMGIAFYTSSPITSVFVSWSATYVIQ